MFLQIVVRIEAQGCDDVRLSSLCSGEGPVLFWKLAHSLRKNQRLRHLPQVTVPQDHAYNSIFVGQLESLYSIVGQLLNIARCNYQHMVVAVSTAACCLEVVSLGSCDVSKAGTASHHVYNYSRKLSSGHIGNSFLLKGDSRG